MSTDANHVQKKTVVRSAAVPLAVPVAATTTPAPKPPMSAIPQSTITPEEAARRAAAARAYALSDTSSASRKSSASAARRQVNIATAGVGHGNGNGAGMVVGGGTMYTRTPSSVAAGTGTGTTTPSSHSTPLLSRVMIPKQLHMTGTPPTSNKSHGGVSTAAMNARGRAQPRPLLPTVPRPNTNPNNISIQAVQNSRLMDIGDEEYAKFVRSLWIDDDIEDDEEDYCEGDEDEEEDDEEDETTASLSTPTTTPPTKKALSPSNNISTQHDGKAVIPDSATAVPSTKPQSSTPTSIGLDVDMDIDLDLSLFDPLQLEEELGGLLEEDMEAAVSSLIMQDSISHAHKNIGMGMTRGTPSSIKKKGTIGSSPEAMGGGLSVGAVAGSGHGNGASKQIPAIAMASPSKAVSKAAASKFPVPSDAQVLQLQKLMNQHYQILLQQSILAVRAAHGNKFKEKKDYSKKEPSQIIGIPKRKRVNEFFFCGENADDLGAVVDGAVNMLQDLDKNRKDAIRYSIQMNRTSRNHSLYKRMKLNSGRAGVPVIGAGSSTGSGTGSGMTAVGAPQVQGFGATASSVGNGGQMATPLHHGFYTPSTPSAARTILSDEHDNERVEEQGCLTRSKFERTLRETDMVGATDENSNSMLGASTTFGVRGLVRLDETFAAIDNSLSAAQQANGLVAESRLSDGSNIFDEVDHGRACEKLLRHAKADYDQELVPGYRDLSYLLTYPSEVTGLMNANNHATMTKEQQRLLRQNRAQFTAAEDNLLLRGVNLYGEKEWMFISDRFLPDRSISIIAQRYWRLCFLIYKGHGIYIDDEGNFTDPPPLLNGIDDFDEAKIQRSLTQVKKPGVFGLYRWSMEEDVMLLKAVPLMGRMFAEIGKRFIAHRDRGALRKRYQVLERRVKGAIKRDKKSRPAAKKIPQPRGPKPKREAPQLSLPAHVPAVSPRRRTLHNPASNKIHPKLLPPKAATPPSTAISTPSPKQGYSAEKPKTEYEKISDIIEGEWSQMSSVRKIIEGGSNKGATNDTSHLTPGSFASKVQSQTQYLPTINYNESNSLTGLSLLGNHDDKTQEARTSPRKSGNIMKSVFDRANKSSQKAKLHPAHVPTHHAHEQVKMENNNSMGMDGFSNFNNPYSASQFPYEHSLMAPPDTSELDAATVLNQMSQMSDASMPFRSSQLSESSLPSSPLQPTRNSSPENRGSRSLKPTSLFEKVVGTRKKS